MKQSELRNNLFAFSFLTIPIDNRTFFYGKFNSQLRQSLSFRFERDILRGLEINSLLLFYLRNGFDVFIIFDRFEILVLTDV